MDPDENPVLSTEPETPSLRWPQACVSITLMLCITGVLVYGLYLLSTTGAC